ncbi:DNA-binding transcriptional regulator, MarR family [Tistlia consotensis]|uniref:DNA-binding transcriptional regulator, MarR family n=1 Tax=Tistlia consotensis USBA 355 TaxID=560819 RepID=A0A1Y6C430_9PROT|nr:MarR family winged helix-turn-helix transcriptional regulator [Tistlia consotensis]SMF41940.1 DNA-binding transcriptional regulator, MarR family [Tistlia consotensis USBA 355]SNR73186.1 DNA-binding transcriptional regulator, MarR family [Tistlia consotensis]
MPDTSAFPHELAGLSRVIEILRTIDSDMTVQAVAIFLAICRREGITMKELGIGLGIAQSSVSRNVAALSDKARRDRPALGLVAAEEDPDDWRRKIVRLTPRGRQVRAQLAEPLR